MDAGNLLKPALASGKLRCIGSTTFSDVKQSFDKDRALSRRFQKIEVLEPTEAETIEILKGLKARLRIASRRDVPGRDARGRRDAVGAALEGSASARQGDRRDRRGGRREEAVGTGSGPGTGRSTGSGIGPEVTVADIETIVAKIARVPVQAVSSDDKVALQEPRRRVEVGDLRAGCGDRGGRLGDQAVAIGPARRRQADGQLPVRGPDRRRQDRAGAAAGARAEGRVPALRHVGVHGEARGVAPDRRAAGIRRLRRGRPADRRDPQVAARGAAARRDREGASRSVRDPAAGDGSRDADRHARPPRRLPSRHPDHDDQRRRARSVGPQDGLLRERAGHARPPASSSACSRRSSATASTRSCTSPRSARREIELRRRQAHRRAARSWWPAGRSPSS